MKGADAGALRTALDLEPDYSEAFTDKVKSLVRALQEVLSARIEHDADMNYSAAQKIVIWLDGKCRPVWPSVDRAVFQVLVLVSSRGAFFTIVTMRLTQSATDWKEKGLEKPGPVWAPAGNGDLPDEIVNLKKTIAAVMQSKHYTLLEGPVLSREVAGQLTELDGKPATVFEVLFSEVY